MVADIRRTGLTTFEGGEVTTTMCPRKNGYGESAAISKNMSAIYDFIFDLYVCYLGQSPGGGTDLERGYGGCAVVMTPFFLAGRLSLAYQFTIIALLLSPRPIFKLYKNFPFSALF